MADVEVELTEDEFDRRYPLLPNLFRLASGRTGGGFEYLFAATGREFVFVRCQNPRHVWTLVEADGGALFLVSGLSITNALAYLVSDVPVPDGIRVRVPIPREGDRRGILRSVK